MRSNPTYWDKVKKELRPRFNAVGLLNICELWDTDHEFRSPKCEKNRNLTFAHSLRRKYIDKYKKNDLEEYERRMREVARLCTPCHAIVDANKGPVAEAAIVEIIKKRKKPVV